MAITQISRKEFDVYGPARSPGISLLATEKSWFADDERNVIGAILFDKSDKDWNYVILGPDETNTFRWIAGDSSFETKEIAEASLRDNMSRIESTGQFEETLYVPEYVEPLSENTQIVFKDINEELKEYFAKHPEKLYDLTSRKFEELVASIMEDFGFTGACKTFCVKPARMSIVG